MSEIRKFMKRINISVGTVARALCERLGGYCSPLKAAMRYGHRRDLWLGRIFLAQAILNIARRVRSAGFFRVPLERILMKQQQLLVRHPNLVGNVHDRKLQLLSVCVTYHCNRNCKFCYAKGLQDEYKQHMPLSGFEFLARWVGIASDVNRRVTCEIIRPPTFKSSSTRDA